jgi:TonB family protein
MTSERTLGWVDGLTQGLIRRAARRAPDSLSERLEEEWQADLAERRGAWPRLRFALGCCWATRVIAHDLGVAALPAAGSAVARGYSIGYAHEHSPLFSRRTMTFVLVACLHAAVLYGLMVGLSSKFNQVNATRLEARQILTPPHRDLPSTPRPNVSATRIDATLPDLPPIEPAPPDVQRPAIHDPAPPELPPTSPPALVSRVQGGPGIGFPSTDDFYPSIAIFMGEKGSATVKVCVDSKGRLTAEPAVVQSTGSPRLDEGALKLARAGSGHYRASTEDGRPVNSCYPFRIRFDLRN